MSNGTSTPTGASTATGGVVRKVNKVLSNVSFGVEHKEPASGQGKSGRPAGSIDVQLDDQTGLHTGYLIEAPFFGPTQNEKQEQYGGATLAASGGYLKNADDEFVQINIGGKPCRIKWSGMVTAIPMTIIEQRKAEAAAKRKATLAAK